MREPHVVPLEFLLESSMTSLQDLEMASLNRSANISKAIRVELEEWIDQVLAAVLARWMMANRERLLEAGADIQRANAVDFFERKKSA